MGVQILNKDVSIISSIVGRAKATINSVGGITGWAGGGAIVTPSPTPNWVQNGIGPLTTSQQILGITQNITLRLNWDTAIIYGMYPYINGIYTGIVYNNGTFTVSPNDTIYYIMDYTQFVFIVNATVTNVSDNNTILDTFTIDYAD